MTGLDADFICPFVDAGLKDVVDEVVVHSSLVCLIITSQSEHSLHPSLTEVQGSHFIQGFARIRPADQVKTQVHTQACTHWQMKSKKKKQFLVCYCL